MSSAKILVQVKSQGENSKTPSWTKSRLTLTHLIEKTKQNLKDDTYLKITFKIPVHLNSSHCIKALDCWPTCYNQTVVVSITFTKSFEKIRLESKWKTTFWVVPVENFPLCQPWKGSPVLVLGRNGPNGKFVFHFFEPSLMPLSGIRGCFPINGNELYKR